MINQTSLFGIKIVKIIINTILSIILKQLHNIGYKNEGPMFLSNVMIGVINANVKTLRSNF
jgi:hypothetical protein